jgi:hypothetical protein
MALDEIYAGAKAYLKGEVPELSAPVRLPI